MIGWAGQARVLPGVVVRGGCVGDAGKNQQSEARIGGCACSPSRWHNVPRAGALPCERHRGAASGRCADLPRPAWCAGHRCHLPQRRALRGEQAPWAGLTWELGCVPGVESFTQSLGTGLALENQLSIYLFLQLIHMYCTRRQLTVLFSAPSRPHNQNCIDREVPR